MTTWERVKARVRELQQHGLLFGAGAEAAMALSEELEALRLKLVALSNKVDLLDNQIKALAIKLGGGIPVYDTRLTELEARLTYLESKGS